MLFVGLCSRSTCIAALNISEVDDQTTSREGILAFATTRNFRVTKPITTAAEHKHDDSSLLDSPKITDFVRIKLSGGRANRTRPLQSYISSFRIASWVEGDFSKTRIVAERIKHRIELEQRRSERHA